MKATTGSIYTVAIILCIVSLPIILISSIVGIVQEIKRVHTERLQGTNLSYNQPKLLADIAVLLFTITIVAAGVIYACISYKLLSADFIWVSITLVVLAVLCGLFALVQRINSSSSNSVQG